jgi:predicted phosphohydrolase
MNDKIQAILLKTVVELKKHGWKVKSDWEITLKSEDQVSLSKQISVEGNLDDREWTDDIDTLMELKLVSTDNLTYFPEFVIYANIFIQGGSIKDVAYKLGADIAFTERDVKDENIANLAATKINKTAEDHIEAEYTHYIDQNYQAIKDYREGGWKADDDAYFDR